MKQLISLLWITLLCFPATVYAVDVTTCQVLDQASTTYELQNDVVSNGTCFSITAADIVLDLGGNTVTFNNQSPITVPNGDFEAGSGNQPNSWDIGSAPQAARAQGSFVDPVSVYSGSYALSFTTPAANQSAVTTSVVNLEANTTYSLTMMARNTVADDITLYAELQGTATRAAQTGRTWRGFQHREVVFTTGGSAESHNIVVGIENAGTAASGTLYIDDVRIQRYGSHGIVVGPPDWRSSWFPDLSQYGAADRAIVRNGTIVQGNGLGSSTHGVFLISAPNAEIYNLNITVNGANAHNIAASYPNRPSIHDNTLYNYVTTITSRDSFDGAVLSLGHITGGEIYRNTIRGGVQNGIVLSTQDPATPTTVYENDISLRTKYTNGFAIQLYGDKGSRVHSNIIDCGSSTENTDCNVLPYDPEGSTVCYSCRGIFVGGGSSANTRIWNNTVRVQELPRSQEYNGCVIGGAYGIQYESSTDMIAYGNNVTAQALQCEASAFRANPGASSSNIYVHDNTFTASKASTPGLVAQSVKLDEITGAASVLRFESNTLETNSCLIQAATVEDVEFRENTISFTEATDDPVIYTYDWNRDGVRAAKNLRFVDSVYEGDARNRFASAVIIGPNTTASEYSSFRTSWTLTVVVKDLQSVPVQGANVQISNNTGTVASGTTGTNGSFSAEVDEFLNFGGTKTTYNPYQIQASKDGLSDSTASDIDRIKEVVLTLPIEQIRPNAPSNLRAISD